MQMSEERLSPIVPDSPGNEKPALVVSDEVRSPGILPHLAASPHNLAQLQPQPESFWTNSFAFIWQKLALPPDVQSTWS